MAKVILASLNDRGVHEGTVYTMTMNRLGVKRNIDCLTPTREMVLGHKHHNGDMRYTNYAKVSDEEYLLRYLSIVLTNRSAIHAWFTALRDEDVVTLCCWCAEGNFCHRQYVAKLLNSWFPHLDVVLH